jgi:hypothetical protein
MTNKAFLGHGIFLELEPITGLLRYKDYKRPMPPKYTTADLVDKFVGAVIDMKMSSVWFEIFTSSGTIDPKQKLGTPELVAGLKAAKIAAIPWGYCWGENSEPDPQNPKKVLDLDRAIKLCNDYGLNLFVADIEPWNENNRGTDKWKDNALVDLMTGLNKHFGAENLGISSFALLDQDSQPNARRLIPPITHLASFCAPQIYWGGKQDPVQWAVKSIQSWRNAGVSSDMIATVQCYWDEHVSQKEMETRVKKFIASYPDSEWSKIVGLNWYHAGNANEPTDGAMSQDMIDNIIAAKLDMKPYRRPTSAPTPDA